MSTNAAIAEALTELAADQDEQRAEAERRHAELLEGLNRIERAFGHWIDEYNQTKAHFEEQFRREAADRQKLGSRLGALELVTGKL